MVKGAPGGLIRVGFKDDDRSFKRIPRSAMYERHLEKVYEIEKDQIDYLVDEFGEAIWADDWVQKCQNKPWTYYIVIKETFVPLDVTEDVRYQGEFILTMENVPMELKIADIECWLRCGLETEDKDFLQAYIDLKNQEQEIKNLQHRITRVPEKEILDDMGKFLPEEKEAEKREALYLMLNKLKREAESKRVKIVRRIRRIILIKKKSEDVKLVSCAGRIVAHHPPRHHCTPPVYCWVAAPRTCRSRSLRRSLHRLPARGGGAPAPGGGGGGGGGGYRSMGRKVGTGRKA
jgi:hypothetical protein